MLDLVQDKTEVDVHQYIKSTSYPKYATVVNSELLKFRNRIPDSPFQFVKNLQDGN